jgi:hypothetical protein
MEKEFVPYTEALALKELGFDEPCFGSYYNNSEENFKEGKFDYRGELNIEYSIYNENTYYILAPTFSQAFRWFRKKQESEGFVHKSIEGNYYFVIKRLGNNESNMYEFTKTAPKTFDVYEEAELACLQKLISIVKEKKL